VTESIKPRTFLANPCPRPYNGYLRIVMDAMKSTQTLSLFVVRYLTTNAR